MLQVHRLALKSKVRNLFREKLNLGSEEIQNSDPNNFTFPSPNKHLGEVAAD